MAVNPPTSNICNTEMKRNALIFKEDRSKAQFETEDIMIKTLMRLEALIAANNESLLKLEKRVHLMEIAGR